MAEPHTIGLAAGSSLPLPGGTGAAQTPNAGTAIQGVDLSSFGDLTGRDGGAGLPGTAGLPQLPGLPVPAASGLPGLPTAPANAALPGLPIASQRPQMSAAARIAQAQARMAPAAAATTPTGIPPLPGVNVNRGMTVAERTAQAARYQADIAMQNKVKNKEKQQQTARNVMTHLQSIFTKKYPVTNQFPELRQFMAKLVTYSIMKWKKKDEIMSLVQRVLSTEITPDAFVTEFSATIDPRNEILKPEKALQLKLMLNRYVARVGQAKAEAAEQARNAAAFAVQAKFEPPQLTVLQSSSEVLSSSQPIGGVAAAVPTAASDPLCPVTQKPFSRKSRVLAGKRFMTSDLKAIGFYSASDLKTLHLALELPDVENGTKVQLHEALKAVRLVMERPAGVISAAPSREPAKTTKRKNQNADRSTEYGGVMREGEDDTMAQCGVAEDEEEAALISYGDAITYTRNPLEHEEMFLDRAVLTARLKQLVAKHIAVDGRLQEDVIRYMSDATEVMVHKGMEDTLRAKRHKSDACTSAPRTERTSDVEVQLQALSTIDPARADASPKRRTRSASVVEGHADILQHEKDAKLAQRTRFINAFRMRVEHQHSSRSRRGDLYKMLLEKTHS